MTTAREDHDEVTVKEGHALPAPEPADAPAGDPHDAPVPVEAHDDVPAPPEADAVAGRALGAAAMLRRLRLEEQGARADIEALKAWVDRHGLFSSFGAAGFELFDAPAGAWTVEDRGVVAWSAEELRLLLWALGRGEAPPLFSRAAVAETAVPLLVEPAPFVSTATLRPLDELEALRALWETLLEATQAEVLARAIPGDPSLATGDELAELLGSLEGFDRDAVTRAEGAPTAAMRGLRLWCGRLVSGLFDEGSPHRAVAFDPAKLQAMSEGALAELLLSARARAAALAWLTEGDAFDSDA